MLGLVWDVRTAPKKIVDGTIRAAERRGEQALPLTSLVEAE